MATPLSRLNVADKLAIPQTQETFEEMYKTGGGHPCKLLLASHWARLVEMGFRSFDPCFSCATHSLPGQMPLQVTVQQTGKADRVFKQYC